MQKREAYKKLSARGNLELDVLTLMQRVEVVERIKHTLQLLRLPLGAFNSHIDCFDNHLKFIHSVPTLDVQLALYQERFKEASRKTHRNDNKDIGFLSVAIPYANFVFAERYWSQYQIKPG